MKIQPHETWSVVDSTKIQQYLDCPRQYFFKYILGWDAIEPNIHLEFGTAWHLAMEQLLNNSYSEENVLKAYDCFLKHYRKYWSDMYDADNGVKTPANALRGLINYVATYPDDHKNYDIMATEIAGVVSLDYDVKGDPMELYFRMDTLMKGEAGYASLEHKTAKSMSRTWYGDFAQATQTGTYLHVLHSQYAREEVDAIYINGFEPHNQPRTKKNGEPYAGDVDCRFDRFPIRRTMPQMEDWFDTTSYWMRLLKIDTDMMLEDQEKVSAPVVMPCFHKNTRSCTKYFGCAFADICRAWPNPMREDCQIVQPGYTKRYWDPRPAELGGTDEEQTAKKVIRA